MEGDSQLICGSLGTQFGGGGLQEYFLTSLAFKMHYAYINFLIIWQFVEKKKSLVTMLPMTLWGFGTKEEEEGELRRNVP